MSYVRTALLFFTMLIVLEVRAWSGFEHSAIGRNAYTHACKSIPRPESSGEALRWDLACAAIDSQAVGQRVLLAERFGEACSLAGDHVGKPEDLLAKLGGRTASSPVRYGLLAVTNVEHFHPTVKASWRTFHERATLSALRPTADTRYAIETSFLQALSEEAFAVHYLQDAFAAGHMGVNRPASSVSAVLAHHDRWNMNGRCVANLRGDVWVAYGDKAYGNQTNSYVVDATAASLSDVIRSFVFQRHHEDGYALAAEITPSFGMSEPTVTVMDNPDRTPANRRKRNATADCKNLAPEDYESLDQIGWPAEVTGTFDVWWFADRVPREDGTINTRGVVVGYSIAGLLVRLGHRRVATRTYLALGAAAVGPREQSTFFADTGYLVRVGMSNQGLIVYEVGLGSSFPLQKENTPSTVRLIFGGNVELGGFYVRVQVGPAAQVRDKRAEWGPFYTVGIGKVWTARVMPGH